jgi:hypothetical protein
MGSWLRSERSGRKIVGSPHVPIGSFGDGVDRHWLRRHWLVTRMTESRELIAGASRTTVQGPPRPFAWSAPCGPSHVEGLRPSAPCRCRHGCTARDRPPGPPPRPPIRKGNTMHPEMHQPVINDRVQRFHAEARQARLRRTARRPRRSASATRLLLIRARRHVRFGLVEVGLRLARQLKLWQFQLIDCQVANDHLFTLGAVKIPRHVFQRTLLDFTCLPSIPAPWQFTSELVW